jgi:PDZ domain
MMPMLGLYFRNYSISLATALLVLGANRTLRAADPPTLLEQLSAETQRVYDQVRVGIIRVQVPSPQWLQQINQQQQLLEQLNANVRDQMRTRTEIYQQAGALAATQPSIVAKQLALFAVGLTVDHDGHAMVPMYIDPLSVGDTKLSVRTLDGRQTKARLIGSDQKTNLSVFQLDEHSSNPVTLAKQRPADGSLTLVISADGSARLSVWNSLHPDSGLIVLPDGTIAGFGSNGRFLATADVQPVVDQLISTGHVRRAILGVNVDEVGKDDAIRQQTPQLASRPALLITNVVANTVADRAGLRAGDLILSVDDKNVGDKPTFAAVIAARTGKTDLQIMRGADILKLSIDLEPQ